MTLFLRPVWALIGAWATSALAQAPPPLELLSPRDAATSTTRDFTNVLGRSTPGAKVRVAGEAVVVWPTGVFARDRIPLAMGRNTLRIEATGADGQRTEKLLDVERVAPPAPVAWPADRLFINGASLRPDQNLRVAPGEPVEVAVSATPGQRVEARLPGQRWQPLLELGPTSGTSGRYRALLNFTGSDDVPAAAVQLRISAQTLPRNAGPRQITVQTPADVGSWRNDTERLYVVSADGAELLHGLHDVRLGGPFLAELPAGTLLQATAQHGEFVRVQLSPDTIAWVDTKSLAPAASGTAAPHAFFTSVAVAGEADGDVVTIPLNARVPYALNAVTTAEGRHELQLDIYGSHHAATWISQRATAKLVREVSVQQAGPEHVRVRITPHAPHLWGWRVERTPTALRVLLRAAPVLAAPPASPLAGLRVALEAGHGGPDNLGAVGATNTPEKDINRWTVDALKAELEAAGATVLLVREGDDNPTLRERARRVVESQAALFVSVHANASDTGAGFLRASGTATFYKHSPHHDLAAAVQRRLLEQTGLDDFGLVGNFNYTPMRLTTWMPAVLVEQAFVSHPGDEAKLLDPAFRALLARAVRMGLEDFLRAR